MKHRRLLAAMLALSATCAIASEFSVTPVRIFMTPRDRAVAITIVNESDDEMVMQADLFSWAQKPNGEDDLTPTEDIVLSPPIVRLGPKSRQVVRLARVGPPPAAQEQTFRMVVREVPEAKPTKELKVQMALAFSLPVFVTPPGAKRQLSCSAQRIAPDTVKAVCENTGRAYAQARGFALLGAKGEKLVSRQSGGYILAQGKRDFDMKAAGRIPGGRHKLQVSIDDGTDQVFDVDLPD
jgi:fimbrial chaperone protein